MAQRKKRALAEMTSWSSNKKLLFSPTSFGSSGVVPSAHPKKIGFGQSVNSRLN